MLDLGYVYAPLLLFWQQRILHNFIVIQQGDGLMEVTRHTTVVDKNSKTQKTNKRTFQMAPSCSKNRFGDLGWLAAIHSVVSWIYGAYPFLNKCLLVFLFPILRTLRGENTVKTA
jgi:hypothetical protein